MLFVAAGASAVVVKEDGEAVSKACKEAANEKTDFVWTQLRALGTLRNCSMRRTGRSKKK